MSDFPLLTPAESAALNAMRFDEATVEPLKQLNPAVPPIVASYRGSVFLVRPPVLDKDEIAGLEKSKAEADWDAGWAGPVINSGDVQAILTAILSTPEPSEPGSSLTPPNGLYASPALAFDAGTATQVQPGIWSVDEDALRATYGSSAVASVELWFRWNGDATAPSGTTRQVGVQLRQQNATNAVEVLWQFAPTNAGIIVQRRVAGVVTAESASATNIPSSPADGQWHKLRVDLAGSSLTVRCDDINPIAWQGTLSGTALGISGPPGVRVDNGRADFVLWCPQPPVTQTLIQVDITPQANRPGQMIEATQYPIGGGPSSQPYSGNITIERMIAVNKTNRLNLEAGVPGFTGLALKFAPKPGDLFNNGNRVNLKGTSTDVAARKCLLAFPGDRTRDTFKFRVPSTFPSELNKWGLVWQYHQEGSVGLSPPIAFNVRQHPVTGLYWIWLGVNADFYNANGQPYTNYYNADGTFGPGGEIKWAQVLTLGQTYEFVLDVYHSTVDAGGVETATLKRGKINSLVVDGVTKISDLTIKTMSDSYNFGDACLYQHRGVTTDRFNWIGDWDHELRPGPNNPLFPFFTAP